MGANFSSILTHPILCFFYTTPPPQSPTTPSLGDLPESCVASILSNLDPIEICKLARLNRAFRGGSWADFVWESKLPVNYEALIKKVFGDDLDPNNYCKRDIYTWLCRANCFDGINKEVWLDNGTGGVCLSISFKALSITGIDDRRYWSRIPTDESRFRTIAYLQQIWWFEVDGLVEFPLPAGTYSVFFRLQLGKTIKGFGRRICNTEQVHGWDIKPVRFQLQTSSGLYASSQSFLTDPGRWVLYHVGDFNVDGAAATTKIRFTMTQIDCTHTKGGLCVDSVLIYPCKRCS